MHTGPTGSAHLGCHVALCQREWSNISYVSLLTCFEKVALTDSFTVDPLINGFVSSTLGKTVLVFPLQSLHLRVNRDLVRATVYRTCSGRMLLQKKFFHSPLRRIISIHPMA